MRAMGSSASVASQAGRRGVLQIELRAIAVCIALVALCLAVYFPGLSNGFVWDDEQYLSLNPAVSGGLSPASVRWALTSFHAGNWHPLTWLSHLLDVTLFGLNPAAQHLTNLLLHCANAVLTFLVFRRLTGALWGSAVVAALFAVHPLHVESVAWAAERKDVLSTFFWLLALRAWLGWLRSPRPTRYWIATALFALSLCAKQMPVTFPLLLLLLDWWPLGRLAPGRRLKVVSEKLPLLALSAAGSAVAFLAQSRFGSVGNAPFAARLANVFTSYCAYIGKTVWPSRLALIYPFPEDPPLRLSVVLACVALAATTVLALRWRRRFPALAVGWLWFLCALVPVIGLIQVGNQALADRYTYVPLTGLFLAAVWGINILTAGLSRRTPLLAAVAVVVLCALVLTSRAQVRTWRDPRAAFENAVNVTADNSVAEYNLGVYHHNHGDDRLAEEHFRKAIAIRNDAEAHRNLALILEPQGKRTEAMREFAAAARADDRFPEVYYNLGRLLADAGQLPFAKVNLEHALQLQPAYPEAHARLGELLAGLGMTEAALTHFREAVCLSPQIALYHSDLGAALATLGEVDAAVSSFREALRLDPGFRVARKNLDTALSRPAPGVVGSAGR